MTAFSSNAIEQLFAADVELGAGAPPAMAPSAVKMLNDQFVNVASAVTPSVVSISVKTDRKGVSMRGMPQDFFRFFGPDMGTPEGDEEMTLPESEAGGSGVIVTADGYVVTNNHVVENAKEGGITVTTTDQKQYKAKLVGRDPLTDLAVLRIDGRFSPAHLAQRTDIRIGEWVVAVGSPLGLKSTITTGIVSAMGRSIGIVGTNEMNSQRNRYSAENFIQTDAAINPGNSGGPLLNMEGEVIGINTAVNREGQGIGFAIPSNMARQLLPSLLESGRVSRSWLGVYIDAVEPRQAAALGLAPGEGALVADVVPGGPAALSGIRPGDVIVSFSGQPIQDAGDLIWIASTAGVGQSVSIEVVGVEGRRTVQATLGELPE
jgi:serine protease Do